MYVGTKNQINLTSINFVNFGDGRFVEFKDVAFIFKFLTFVKRFSEYFFKKSEVKIYFKVSNTLRSAHLILV